MKRNRSEKNKLRIIFSSLCQAANYVTRQRCNQSLLFKPMNNLQLGTIVGWVKAAGRNPSKQKRWVTLRSTHPTENHIEAYNFFKRELTYGGYDPQTPACCACS